MPSTLTYPGVYVEEVPSGVRTIVGVATSIAAFVGRAARGPTDEATTVFGFAEYERVFGGLHRDCPMSYAVRDFFLNGGAQAVVVRVFAPAPAAAPPGPGPAPAPPAESAVLIVGGNDGVNLEAAQKGAWGGNLRGRIDFAAAEALKGAAKGGGDAARGTVFDLTIREDATGGAVEVFRAVTSEDTARRVDKVVNKSSALVRWKGAWHGVKLTTHLKALVAVYDAAVAAMKTATDKLADPKVTDKAAAAVELAAARRKLAEAVPGDRVTVAAEKLAAAVKGLDDLRAAGVPDGPGSEVEKQRALIATATGERDTAVKTAAEGAADGGAPGYAQYFPADGADQKTGVYALDTTDLFNILCLPTFGTPDTDVIARAAAYCERRRAVLIVDPPPSDATDWGSAKTAKTAFLSDTGFPRLRSSNAALYFPRVKYPDPQQNGEVREFPASGMIAGLYAKTDTTRGVWKAPAGVEAGLLGAQELAVKLTDGDNGLLNPLGVNCLRSFPAAGRVVWGARTLRGADVLADDYKYVPVRRLALFLEESLYRGTQWAVFEPNAEPLWAQLRLAVGDFLHGLYRQGAFAGASPAQAYRVTCDGTTTTPGDVDRGVVNVLVAFAPLKPAEFVVLRVQQLARPAAT